MKPTETPFEGTMYRSFLEAHWAAIFARACPKWSYEPRKFLLLGKVPYWPDFYIDAVRAWLEIKPAPIDPGFFTKAQALAAQIEDPVYLFSGRPKIHVPRGSAEYRLSAFRVWRVLPKGIQEMRFHRDDAAPSLASLLQMTDLVSKLGVIHQDFVALYDGREDGQLSDTIAGLQARWSSRTTHHGQ